MPHLRFEPNGLAGPSTVGGVELVASLSGCSQANDMVMKVRAQKLWSSGESAIERVVDLLVGAYYHGIIVVIIGSSFPRLWWIVAGSESDLNEPRQSQIVALNLLLFPAVIRGWQLLKKYFIPRHGDLLIIVLTATPVVLGTSMIWSAVPSRTFLEGAGLFVSALATVGVFDAFRTIKFRGEFSAMLAATIPLLWSLWRVFDARPGATTTWGRWIGIFNSQNHLAPLAGVLLLASIVMLIGTIRAHLRCSGRFTLLFATRVVLCAFVAVASFVTVIKTYNATVQISLALIGGFVVVIQLVKRLQCWNRAAGRRVPLAVTIGAVALPAVAIASVVMVQRMDWSFRGRRPIWAASIEGVIQKPLFGWGFQAPWFSEEFRSTVAEPVANRRWSHNMWLDVAMGGGALVGLVFAVATVALIVRLTRDAWADSRRLPALVMTLFISLYLTMEPLSENNWYLYGMVLIAAVSSAEFRQNRP